MNSDPHAIGMSREALGKVEGSVRSDVPNREPVHPEKIHALVRKIRASRVKRESGGEPPGLDCGTRAGEEETIEQLRKHKQDLEDEVWRRTVALDNARESLRMISGERERAERELRSYRERFEKLAAERILHLHREIAEIKKMWENQRQSLEHLNAYFGESPACMTILDEDLRFVRINKTAETFYGISQDEIAGRCLCDVVPDIAGEPGDTIRKALASGKPLPSHHVRRLLPVCTRNADSWNTSCFPLMLPGGKKGIGIIAVETSK